MYLIRKTEIIASVPARWAKQYSNYPYAPSGFRHREKMDELNALATPFTAEQANEIIGNDSWTQLTCDECGEDSEELVHLGQEVDYDATYADICFVCIMKASRMRRL